LSFANTCINKRLHILNFNLSGLLVPCVAISSNTTELEKEFVTDLNIAKRKELFEKYVTYSGRLKEICNITSIEQWVDGSFVTKNLSRKT